MSKENFEFKAEISQLLEILVHSLYTNREIFLRELISNASDALEKRRFEQTKNDNQNDQTPFEMKISVDKENKTLTIVDTGIGMTEDEVKENIGTIAHSGTANFAKQLAEGKESVDSIIGRFGVGFYSIFMVADSAELITRSFRDGSKALSWTSDGKSGYEIEEIKEETPFGTKIVVHLKEEFVDQFTNENTIKEIITKHSNFINAPIFVGDTQVNTVSALWREPKFKITKEQYNEFYSFLTYDTEAPLDVLHFSIDAPVQFQSLLFIPEKEHGMFGMDRDNWGQDLYVRRILIEHNCKNLLPEYLSFCKGVVDTEDLPLNISRETLQDNLLLRKISISLTKQVLSHLEKMAKENGDEFKKFWSEHSRVFKTGYMDFLNKDKFANLVRFNSMQSADAEDLVSFAMYQDKVKDTFGADATKEIYYFYAPSREAALLSPYVEIFQQKGIEVLFLYEPIDEFIMEAVREFDGWKLSSIEHADLSTLENLSNVEDFEAPKVEELNVAEKASFDDMLATMKDYLGGQVAEVKISHRLTGAACCLSNPDGTLSSSMERVMRTIQKDSGIPQKVLELNPNHTLLRNMLALYQKDSKDSFIEQGTKQLFESALLLEGYLQDPHGLVGRMNDLLTQSSTWYLQTK